MKWTPEQKREYMRAYMKTYSGPAKKCSLDEPPKLRLVPKTVCHFCSLTIGSTVYRAYQRQYHRNCVPSEPPSEPDNRVRFVYEGGYRLGMENRRVEPLLLIRMCSQVAGEA